MDRREEDASRVDLLAPRRGDAELIVGVNRGECGEDERRGTVDPCRSNRWEITRYASRDNRIEPNDEEGRAGE